MKAKTVATAAVFAALTIALNLSSFKIPAPFAPFLYYQIWEIPLVAVLLLYGVPMGVFVSAINTLVLLLVFPGDLPTGPLYNLAAVLSMMLGIYIAYAMLFRLTDGKREILILVISTILGISTRVGLMSIMNWTLLRYPPPVGFSIPETILVGMIPLIALFNATLALYTIPAGFALAKAVSSGIKGAKMEAR